MQSLDVHNLGNDARLVATGTFGPPSFVVQASRDRRKATIDIQGVSLPPEGAKIGGDAATADSLIRTREITKSEHGVRILIAFSKPCTYRASPAFGRLTLHFEPVLDTDASAAIPRATATPRHRASTSASALGVGIGGGQAPNVAASSLANRPHVPDPALRKIAVRPAPLESARIGNVQAELREGAVRLSIEVDGGSTGFRVEKLSDRSKRLEIDGARLGGDVRQRSVTPPPKSLLRHIQLRQEGDRVVVDVEHTKDINEVTTQQGRQIVWLFSATERQTDRPQSVTVSREAGEDVQEIESSEAAGFVSDVAKQIGGGPKNPQYTGRRIDLDFKDADIHNILRLLAEVGGVNVVTSDDVSGTVTIRMRNAPWDEALETILQSKNLGMVRRSNLIRVAPVEALEKEREAALARRKLQEQLASVETRLVPVSYASAQDLSPRVKELLSGRGSVSVDERTNMLIVRDIVSSLEDVEELVRSLDAQTPQVLIEARVIEASSQYARDIGIQWGGDAVWSAANGNPTGINFPANVGIAGGNYDAQTPTQGLNPYANPVATPNYAVNLPAVTGAGQGGALGMTFGSLNGAFNLSVRISAAESSGTVRIISSPRILTLDNHEAAISQGTLIPYSQVSAQGVQTAFQEAKLELRVKPHVTSDGSITMRVKITRAEPDFTRTGPRGDPTIRKREAETNLLVNDGDTAVIGGIYTRNSGRNKNQVPFFGDIPILGVLFQRRRTTDDRTEMLIFLTPRIVNREEALRL